MTKRAHLAVFVLAGLFGAVFLWHAFARYNTFHNQTFDLAFYARMAWGAAHGSFWDPIINAHFLGLHLSLLMIPLGLLGLVFGAVPVLLTTQVLAVCVACWPLARLGARRFGTTGAIISALAWLLYPNIGHTLTNEFHPGTVATLPLFFALDALDREDRKGLIWSSIALVACRADLSLMAMMLGVLAIFKSTGMRKAGFWVAGLSLSYLLVFTVIVQPAFAPAYGSLQAHFEKWGNSVPQVISTIFSSPRALFHHLTATRRLFYLPKILAPLLFLPLLSPRWLLVALPPAAINLISAFPTTTDMDCHYQTLLVPPLLVAAIIALGAIHSGFVKRLAWVLLLIGGCSANLLAAGMPWSRDYISSEYREDAVTRSSRRTLAVIPDGASVQAPDRLLPHLAERMDLFRAPPPERLADFVVLDISHRQRFAHSEDLIRTIEEPLVSDWFVRSDHAVIHAENDLVVLQRNRSPREGLTKRYFIGKASPDEGTALTACLAVLGGSLHKDELCLDFVARGPCARDLAIRLGSLPKSRRVDLLFDGLLSPVHLQPSDRVRSCHSLQESERQSILSEGLYVGTLRQSGARPEHSDPISVKVDVTVTEPIIRDPLAKR
jgi:uncharacterized membrane protein